MATIHRKTLLDAEGKQITWKLKMNENWIKIHGAHDKTNGKAISRFSTRPIENVIFQWQREISS